MYLLSLYYYDYYIYVFTFVVAPVVTALLPLKHLKVWDADIEIDVRGTSGRYWKEGRYSSQLAKNLTNLKQTLTRRRFRRTTSLLLIDYNRFFKTRFPPKRLQKTFDWSDITTLLPTLTPPPSPSEQHTPYFHTMRDGVWCDGCRYYFTTPMWKASPLQIACSCGVFCPDCYNARKGIISIRNPNGMWNFWIKCREQACKAICMVHTDHTGQETVIYNSFDVPLPM
jgi:hypothetical protein